MGAIAAYLGGLLAREYGNVKQPSPEAVPA
jgi:hypothetical protein